MISSSAWGTKWYITLFVNTVPFSQQLRLWDALWLQGRDVMIVTSIAILWSFKGESMFLEYTHIFYPFMVSSVRPAHGPNATRGKATDRIETGEGPSLITRPPLCP